MGEDCQHEEEELQGSMREAGARLCSHKGVNNQREIDKGEKDNIKFIITCENAAKAFDTPKQSLDLIALFVQLLIIAPGFFRFLFGGTTGIYPSSRARALVSSPS